MMRKADNDDIDDLLERFKPDPNAPPSEPLRFALYNLKISDAAFTFDDRPAQRVHRIEALQLALPFLSNLPSQLEVTVEPHLAFRFDGATFDSGAQAVPFAERRRGELKLRLADLDLAQFHGIAVGKERDPHAAGPLGHEQVFVDSRRNQDLLLPTPHAHVDHQQRRRVPVIERPGEIHLAGPTQVHVKQHPARRICRWWSG